MKIQARNSATINRSEESHLWGETKSFTPRGVHLSVL